MSTSHLSAAAEHVERTIMLDSCTITRDPAGVIDDVLDPVTLQLSKPVDDAETIYSGICLVSPATTMERTTETTGRLISGRRYGVRIPIAAPAVSPGDLVKITDSERDPSLIGRELRVESITRQTLGVTRQIVVIEVDQR